MGPVLLDVADGDDLHVGAGEDAADLADGLGAEADAGQGNLLAGRDESRPAQDVSRHDGEGGARQYHLPPRESPMLRMIDRIARVLRLRILGFHDKTSESLGSMLAEKMSVRRWHCRGQG